MVARQVVAGMGIEACVRGMQSNDSDSETQYWAVKVLRNLVGYTHVDLAYWKYLQRENCYLPIEMAIRMHNTEGAKELLKLVHTDPEEEDRKKLELLLARQHRKRVAIAMQKRKADEAAEAARLRGTPRQPP